MRNITGKAGTTGGRDATGTTGAAGWARAMSMTEPRGGDAAIGWTIAGMAATIALMEGWGDVAVAIIAYLVIVLWARPVRLRALLLRLVPFVVFAGMALAFGVLGIDRGAIATGDGRLQALSGPALAGVRLLLVGVAASWLGLYVGAARMLAFLASLGRATRRLGVDLTVPLLAMGVAIRFLPLLQEEARRLQAAWQARGAGLPARGIAGRIRYGAAVAVPLMAAALRRAEALAEAIEVRLGGTSFREAELWQASSAGVTGRAQVQRGSALRIVAGVAAAWCVVALRVWRWVG